MLAPVSGQMTRPASIRVDAVVSLEKLIPAVKDLRMQTGAISLRSPGWISLCTRWIGEKAAETHHWRFFTTFCEGAAVATLRVVLPYAKPVIPLSATFYPGYPVRTRSMEMFGVTIEAHRILTS